MTVAQLVAKMIVILAHARIHFAASSFIYASVTAYSNPASKKTFAREAMCTSDVVTSSLSYILLLIDPRTLGSNDAKLLAGGRLHHDPCVNLRDAFRAEFFETSDFGFDVIGFDI